MVRLASSLVVCAITKITHPTVYKKGNHTVVKTINLCCSESQQGNFKYDISVNDSKLCVYVHVFCCVHVVVCICVCVCVCCINTVNNFLCVFLL